MASCKDCLQYDVCECADGLEYRDAEHLKRDCPRFKNKADFVEVVRCKGCQHFSPFEYFEQQGQCMNPSGLNGIDACVSENDFCSYGERVIK